MGHRRITRRGGAPGPYPRQARSAAVWTATKWMAPGAVGLIVYPLPQPDGIKPDGWAVLSIFTATVLGLILQPREAGTL
ncbi:anion permease [Streptomyces sp. NPDC006265]|uniref:anion permease n=1 Tax=Streptomyces sp. NPDC006265 TaxID=3156740 RepID=UPI0033A43EAA